MKLLIAQIMHLWMFYEQMQALKGNTLTRTGRHGDAEVCAHLSCCCFFSLF